MIKRAGLNFTTLPDEKFDPIFGIASGAADIFGVTGGVMEAALRTVSSILMGDENAPLEFHDVRGFENVKEATYELPGKTVRVAVVSGTKNAGRAAGLPFARVRRNMTSLRLCAAPAAVSTAAVSPMFPPTSRTLWITGASAPRRSMTRTPARNCGRATTTPLCRRSMPIIWANGAARRRTTILHTKYYAQPKYRI